MREGLERTKSGKAVGSDNTYGRMEEFEEVAVEFLTGLLCKILERQRMPEVWISVLLSIFKNKGNVQSCRN